MRIFTSCFYSSFHACGKGAIQSHHLSIDVFSAPPPLINTKTICSVSDYQLITFFPESAKEPDKSNTHVCAVVSK